MLVLDQKQVERSNWLDWRRTPTARRHRGYWYDPADPQAFHSPEEIDDHIRHVRIVCEIESVLGDRDLRRRLRERLEEHPEERAWWPHLLPFL